MRKFLLMSLTAMAAGGLSAQVLWQDDFEAYSIGNFTDQGGWMRDGGDDDWVRIVNLDDQHGKSLRFFTTETNDSGIFVTQLNNWNIRNTQNNRIVAEFDFYTGQPMDGIGMVVIGTEDYEIIMELGWSAETNALYISGENMDEVLLENPEPDTWYHFTAMYDTETGEIRARVNDGAVITGTGSPGMVPEIFDFTSLMASDIAIDNIVVTATNADVLATTDPIAVTAATTLFPNPASDVIRVRSTKKIAETAVYDLTGKAVGTAGAGDAITIGNLPKGNYLLHIRFSDGTTEMRKFIKK